MACHRGGDQRDPDPGLAANGTHAELSADSHHIDTYHHAYVPDDHSHEHDSYDEHAHAHDDYAQRKIRLLTAGRLEPRIRSSVVAPFSRPGAETEPMTQVGASGAGRASEGSGARVKLDCVPPPE